MEGVKENIRHLFKTEIMKKVYTIIAAVLSLSSANAETFKVGSGKWTDAAVWGGHYAGATVKAEDVVIITGQITLNTAIVVEGTLQIEKGAGMVGMKDMMVTKSGKFVNNGNAVLKRIINEGTINNNQIMEAILDIDNRGDINNNNNMVAGNSFSNISGDAAGKGGAYYVNNNVSSSPTAKFGKDVKVFAGNMMETVSAPSPLNLDAMVISNCVILNVTNPSKVDVTNFSIEKSSDGQNFSFVKMISNSGRNAESAMTYTDTKINSNLTYYRVKAISANGTETTLPLATVKAPVTYSYAMAF